VPFKAVFLPQIVKNSEEKGKDMSSKEEPGPNDVLMGEFCLTFWEPPSRSQ
jgi:hypothetical protein